MNDFKLLIDNISVVHKQLQQQATSAINQALTIRNWVIGFYIVEYEQNGNDRAVYGEQLLYRLAQKFTHVKGLDERSFRSFRLLYQYYPQIRGSLTSKLGSLEKQLGYMSVFQELEIRGSATTELDNIQTTSQMQPNVAVEFEHKVKGEIILSKLSYTHKEQLERYIDVELKKFV